MCAFENRASHAAPVPSSPPLPSSPLPDPLPSATLSFASLIPHLPHLRTFLACKHTQSTATRSWQVNAMGWIGILTAHIPEKYPKPYVPQKEREGGTASNLCENSELPSGREFSKSSKLPWRAPLLERPWQPCSWQVVWDFLHPGPGLGWA